jgi:hypothetical protein
VLGVVWPQTANAIGLLPVERLPMVQSDVPCRRGRCGSGRLPSPGASGDGGRTSERYANLRQQAKFADPQPGGYHVWLEAVEEGLDVTGAGGFALGGG